MSRSVTVIGAGVSGLACACALLDEAEAAGTSLDLTVFEAGHDAGGHVRTHHVEGFAIEQGPNGFLAREPETMARIERLGLMPRLVEANAEARRRFILRDGRLCQVPDGPRTLLTSRALSWRGTLRLLGEPWAAAAPAGEETVYDFATRRIGREAADVLVDTAVSGISAGDSRQLSVAAQFPMMVEMEREHGGLFRAMFARRSRGRTTSRLVSFDRGLGVLTGAMAARVGARLRTSRRVVHVRARAGGWTVMLAGGDAHHTDQVVLATAACAAAPLVSDVAPDLSAALRSIPYAGLAVVAIGIRAADPSRPLDGYGYLVPRHEGLATLGVLWESSIFPGRAPAGHALLRVFLGGARRPDAVTWDDAALVGTARRELGPLVAASRPPIVAQVFRWPEAIAQYTLGHLARRTAIAEATARHAGLHLCGASYDGVSFTHALASGHRAARAVAAQPAARRPEAAPARLA